jgi:hypothetical protein
MDPAAIDLLAKVSVELFLRSIRAAWNYHNAADDAVKATKDRVQETYELALRLMGSLLFETRANVERVRFIADHAGKNTVTYGVFDFSVSSALLPDLCRVAPAPVVLEKCRSLLAVIRRVDFYQREAAGVDTVKAIRAIAFANDAMGKDVVGRFNELVDFGNRVAAEALGDSSAISKQLFPERIDPASKVDHSML